jgi:predicted DCC family thiol-disulfide oxidoreductase YuxK
MEGVMSAQYPLVVFYDHSCSLCRNEMLAIKAHDADQKLILVDCSAEDFDDVPFRREGITRQDMMACLHVRDNRGAWIKGVSSFELLYRSVGMNVIANFWSGYLTRPAMERVYPWVVKHRQRLSWTGLPILFALMRQCAEHRAHSRSRKCHEGQCQR